MEFSELIEDFAETFQNEFKCNVSVYFNDLTLIIDISEQYNCFEEFNFARVENIADKIIQKHFGLDLMDMKNCIIKCNLHKIIVQFEI